jgi:hypothetical protein
MNNLKFTLNKVSQLYSKIFNKKDFFFNATKSIPWLNVVLFT